MSKGKDKEKDPEKHIDLIIEQEQTETLELQQPKKKGRGRLTYKKEKKTTWHLYSLQGIVSPDEFVKIVNGIMTGEHKLIK